MSLQLLQYCVKNMSSEKQLILVSNPVNACSDCIGHFHNCLHAPSALYLHVTCIVKFMLCGVIIICWGEGVAIRMDAGHLLEWMRDVYSFTWWRKVENFIPILATPPPPLNK